MSSQSYKIQNRSSQSKRILLNKNNGATINFDTIPPSSFVENPRSAGFCLNPINTIPDRTPPHERMEISAHPMGTDGRVTILTVAGVVIHTERYAEQLTVHDRQQWFNDVFGEYVNYSGLDTAIFTTLYSDDIITVIFEDDDIDYVFNNFSTINVTENQTLFVEQYRLAFDLRDGSIL